MTLVFKSHLVKKSSPFPSVCLLFIGLVDFCVIQWAVAVPDLASKSPFDWLLVFLFHASTFFFSLSTFLFSGTQGAHLVNSLPQLWNQPFLQGTLVPFSGEWYFKAKLCVLGVCRWCHSSRFGLSRMVDPSYRWQFTFKIKFKNSVPRLRWAHFRLISHTWVVAALLDSTHIGRFYYHRGFNWTALFLDPSNGKSEDMMSSYYHSDSDFRGSSSSSPRFPIGSQRHQHIYILFSPTVDLT